MIRINHKNLPVFIPHLACKNDCVFCNQKKIAGTLSPPSPSDVKKLLQDGLFTVTGDTQIAFFGGSFTGLEEQQMKSYLEAAFPFIKPGGYSGIRLSTRPDYISRDILTLLKSYAVKTIELGVQSLDSDVLKASHRGHTAEDVYTACRLIKEFGFELVLQMMTGLPLDTKEKDLETAEKIATLKPDGVRIYPTVVIKETDLYQQYLNGSYKPLSLEEAVDICSELLVLFERENIPVIRLGLHADPELTNGDAIATGPFHPSFGELCQSKIYFDILLCKMKNIHFKNIEIFCPLGEVSKVTGNQKKNISQLKSIFDVKNIKVTEDNSLKGRNIRILPLERKQKA